MIPIPTRFGRRLAFVAAILVAVGRGAGPAAAQTPPMPTDEQMRLRGLSAELLANVPPEALTAIFLRLRLEAPLELRRCLCSSAGHTTGVGVLPEGDRCRFNGTGGTWLDEMPSDRSVWNTCMNTSRMADGRTVAAAFVEEMKKIADRQPWPAAPNDAVAAPTTPLANTPALLRATLQKYRRMCLPTPYRLDDVLTEDVWGAFLRENILDGAQRMVSEARNDCEAAISAKLYLDGQNGSHAAEIVWKTVETFALADKWKVAEGLVETEPMLGRRVRASAKSALGLLGSIDNATDYIAYVDKELKTHERNLDVRAGFDLFRASADWPVDKINDRIEFLERSMVADHRSILTREIDLEREKEAIRPHDGAGNRLPFSAERPDDQQWIRYRDEEKRLEQQADLDEHQARVLIVRAEIEHQTLVRYRLPLAERGCAALMADWKKACETRIGPVPEAR